MTHFKYTLCILLAIFGAGLCVYPLLNESLNEAFGGYVILTGIGIIAASYGLSKLVEYRIV